MNKWVLPGILSPAAVPAGRLGIWAGVSSRALDRLCRAGRRTGRGTQAKKALKRIRI